MSLYVRAYRGRIYHVAPYTLSQGFDGWPPALCSFRPKHWSQSTNDPKGVTTCNVCTQRKGSEQ